MNSRKFLAEMKWMAQAGLKLAKTWAMFRVRNRRQLIPWHVGGVVSIGLTRWSNSL